jgi:hypothetical protein
VQIAFYNGNTRTSTFDILTSQNGTSWTTAASGRVSSGTSLNLETFSITAATAKYVRIVGHGNSVNAWNSYTEVRIQSSSLLAVAPAAENTAARLALNSYPNPFSRSSIITFRIEENGPAHLSVYDLMGKQVAVLVNGNLSTGYHRITFDPQQLAAGTYLLKLVYNGKNITKMIVKE